VAAVLDEARALDAQLLVVRCATKDLGAAQALEREGAELMDTLVTYTRSLAEVPPRPDPLVRLARDADAPIVAELARAAFAGYQGHYHADSRLDRHQCDEVYVDWALRSCTSRDVADEVLVAELDGRLVGFATLQGDEGVLFGVSPDAQGRGIYRTLMIAGMQRCAARGSTRMIVSTQVTNIAVQKVWVRLGFEPSSSCHTFHKWLA
jgi:GNAT superfamily N-acetyltransferase